MEQIYLTNILNLRYYTDQEINIVNKLLIYKEDVDNKPIEIKYTQTITDQDVYVVLLESYKMIFNKYKHHNDIVSDIVMSLKGLKNMKQKYPLSSKIYDNVVVELDSSNAVENIFEYILSSDEEDNKQNIDYIEGIDGDVNGMDNVDSVDTINNDFNEKNTISDPIDISGINSRSYINDNTPRVPPNTPEQDIDKVVLDNDNREYNSPPKKSTIQFSNQIEEIISNEKDGSIDIQIKIHNITDDNTDNENINKISDENRRVPTPIPTCVLENNTRYRNHVQKGKQQHHSHSSMNNNLHDDIHIDIKPIDVGMGDSKTLSNDYTQNESKFEKELRRISEHQTRFSSFGIDIVPSLPRIPNTNFGFDTNIDIDFETYCDPICNCFSNISEIIKIKSRNAFRTIRLKIDRYRAQR